MKHKLKTIPKSTVTLSIKDHLATLKNFEASADAYGLNKLYLLEVHEKPGLIKIGDTHRDVALRNAETCTNASLHRSNELTYWIAEKEDGTIFRDYALHEFLTSKGYVRQKNEQGNDSEWFYITNDEFNAEFELFMGKPVFKTVELRPAQQYLFDKIIQAIENGSFYLNVGACVRVGKSILSLKVAAHVNMLPVYIGKNLTSQASVNADNAEYGIVPRMLTQSIHGSDNVSDLLDDEVSRKAQSIIECIVKTNVDNQKILFVVDEVDDSSHTKKSRDAIKQVVLYFKEIGLFGGFMTMSGTRIYRGMKVLNDLTSDPITEISLEYHEMQILQPDNTCNRNFRRISFYSQNASGLSNISDAMKNKDKGHASLATVVASLLGSNNYDIIRNDLAPHWFIKFATVGKSNANKFVDYLNRNFSIVENEEYVYAVINGDVTTSTEAQDYCYEIIGENADKICVFITQGMATTSFSVASIGNTAVFTDNELTADDTQSLHRSATWMKDKPECNMMVVTTNDSSEFTFDDIFEDETKLAKTRPDRIEINKEILNNNSIVHYTVGGNGNVRPYKVTVDNVEKVIDKKMKSMTRVASIMCIVNDLDDDILADMLSSGHASKSTSKKSGTATPDNFDPFGEEDEDDNNKSKKPVDDKMSLGKKEKIIRAFVEGAVFIPALAREQDTSIEGLDNWEDIAISKEMFFDVYNSSWMFKDRMDAIFNLCSDDVYLIENYINKLA